MGAIPSLATSAPGAAVARFTVPYPPSDGVYWAATHGRQRRTWAAADYCRLARRAAVDAGLPGHPDGSVRLRVRLCRPTNRRASPLSETVRALLDTLRGAGVFADDIAAGFTVEVRDVPPGEPGRVEIEVEKAAEEGPRC